MQDYFGDRNLEVCKTIFNARGRNLDIKMHKKWKYNDMLCIGCSEKEESETEVLVCKGLGEAKKFDYDMFFCENTQTQIEIGKEMLQRLKNRKKILENIEL